MGHAYVTMDEALGFVAVDLSGRAYSVFNGQWHTPAIGQMPTDLVQHFFRVGGGARTIEFACAGGIRP